MPGTKRDFLRLTDLDRSGLLELIERAAEWKLLGKKGPRPLDGHTIGLIFEKASTRTRVSFEVAAYQLGGHVLFLSPRDTQLGRGEPISDTARVLSRYLDALVVRTFGHDKLEEIAGFATVPVINALTDASHPCQLLADLLTVAERFGVDALHRGGLKIAWIGDGNNMANSWLEACALLGFELALACPPGYDPDAGLLARCGGRARLVRTPAEAAAGAHVLNTDVWASMGQEGEQARREKDFAGFIVDEALLARARPDAVVLHCLPAHRGEEISEAVLEGPRSAVWDEAENRLHAQKALLELLLAGR
ncbi:MAG: ornithine carbamoyltransferase [Anaeromyxobacter sp.]|nr:ornithine carbamoyltransferase [Anaeromyxobacter sp.]MBL0274962.1 ornithine carbamoyltransferase [Anaeromyxobacter sp.]